MFCHISVYLFKEESDDMFGEKEKSRQQTSQDSLPYPTGGDAWGWAATAARFRGIVVLGLLVVVVALSLSNVLLLQRSTVIVGIDRDGRPQILEPVAEKSDLKTFCRDFISFMFSYSPKTIEKNVGVVLNYMTPEMKKAFSVTMGEDFVREVITNGIIQSCAVNSINVTKATEKGYEVEVYVSRIRSHLSGDVAEAQVIITMDIERGPIDRQNPWGLYVSSLVEENLY